MIVIAIIYALCLPAAISVTKSIHDQFHMGQWHIIFTFLRVWFLMPFFFITEVYHRLFNKD